MKSFQLSLKAGIVLIVTFLFGCQVSSARSEYWNQRVSLFETLPIQEDDIVFLGNSITDGGEFAELFSNQAIKNRGISSDVISGVKERLGQISRYKPRKIFLLIGINDISHNLTADEISAEYEMLVKDIRTQTPQTQLYIQSIMPINMDFNRYKALTGKEGVIRDVNHRLKDIAAKYEATYVDLWDALADPDSGKLKPEFTNDGLHLLGTGYQAWVQAIYHLVSE